MLISKKWLLQKCFPSNKHNERGGEAGEGELELWEERWERGLRGRLTAKWRGDRWEQNENSRHPPLIASTGLSPSRYAAVRHSITTVLTHLTVDRPEAAYRPHRSHFLSAFSFTLSSFLCGSSSI